MPLKDANLSHAARNSFFMISSAGAIPSVWDPKASRMCSGIPKQSPECGIKDMARF